MKQNKSIEEEVEEKYPANGLCCGNDSCFSEECHKEKVEFIKSVVDKTQTEDWIEIYYLLKSFHDFTNTLNGLTKADIIEVAYTLHTNASPVIDKLERNLKSNK